MRRFGHDVPADGLSTTLVARRPDAERHILSRFLPRMSPLALGVPHRVASATAGFFLLLLPGLRLLRSHDGREAARLFDRASHDPLAQRAIVTVFVLRRHI